MQGFLFVTGSLSVILGFVALLAGTLQWRGVTGERNISPRPSRWPSTRTRMACVKRRGQVLHARTALQMIHRELDERHVLSFSWIRKTMPPNHEAIH